MHQLVHRHANAGGPVCERRTFESTPADGAQRFLFRGFSGNSSTADEPAGFGGAPASMHRCRGTSGTPASSDVEARVEHAEVALDTDGAATCREEGR